MTCGPLLGSVANVIAPADSISNERARESRSRDGSVSSDELTAVSRSCSLNGLSSTPAEALPHERQRLRAFDRRHPGRQVDARVARTVAPALGVRVLRVQQAHLHAA